MGDEAEVIEKPVRLCKDCKYRGEGHIFDICIKTLKSKQDLVTGYVHQWGINCHNERNENFHWSCGTEGKFFEPKEKEIKKSLWVKIRELFWVKTRG